RLFFLIRAEVLRELGVDLLMLGAVGVREQREVVAEHAVARLDVHVLADGAVPLTLVNPAARDLLERRAEVGVAVGAGWQTVRLNFLAPLVVPNQLVVLVDLIRRLPRR